MTKGHLGYLQFLTIINNPALHNPLYRFLHMSAGEISKTRIPESKGTHSLGLD